MSKRPARPVRARHHALAGFYFGAGLFVVVWSAWVGDPLGAFLGLVAMGAAPAVQLLAETMLGLNRRLTLIARTLEDIRARLRRLEARATEKAQDDTTTIDLADFGAGDPQRLAAATLPRSRYPRLVSAIPDESADRSRRAEAGRRPRRRRTSDDPRAASPSGPQTRDLYAEWNDALRAGDLPACRRIYAAFVDTAADETVARFRVLLTTLTNRVERRLRDDFACCVRSRDYAGALKVGELIDELFPGQPIARDFERIKPYLVRRVV